VDMLTLNRSVVSTETDYGTALLDQRSGRYWTLNPTATVALHVLLDGGDRSHAARALLDRFDVDSATAYADVDRLVEDLHAAGLVTTTPPGEPGDTPAAGVATSSGGPTTSGRATASSSRHGRRANPPRLRLPFRRHSTDGSGGRHSRRGTSPPSNGDARSPGVGPADARSPGADRRAGQLPEDQQTYSQETFDQQTYDQRLADRHGARREGGRRR